jgi:hypothetical protein
VSQQENRQWITLTCLQVEICRFGCPDHCQKPSNYQSREQEVSGSINIPQYRPGPRYEAQKATPEKRVDTRHELSNEIPEVRRPEAPPPRPERLVQDQPAPYQGPAAQHVKTLAPPQSKPPPPRYIPRPDSRPPSASLKETDKKSANSASFFGFKLPQIPPFPWGNSELRTPNPRVESQVSSVPMGVTPPRRTASVPVSRTSPFQKGEQPQVFPSGFNGNARPVEPIEPFESDAGSQFPYGPRGLKFSKRSASRERRDLSEEMGVNSGYQVISEVDLAFKPSFEDGMGVTVFQV